MSHPDILSGLGWRPCLPLLLKLFHCAAENGLERVSKQTLPIVWWLRCSYQRENLGKKKHVPGRFLYFMQWMNGKCEMYLESPPNRLISGNPLLYLILNPSIKIRGIKFPLLILVMRLHLWNIVTLRCGMVVRCNIMLQHGSMHCNSEKLLPKVLDAEGCLQTFLLVPSALEWLFSCQCCGREKRKFYWAGIFSVWFIMENAILNDVKKLGVCETGSWVWRN